MFIIPCRGIVSRLCGGIPLFCEIAAISFSDRPLSPILGIQQYRIDNKQPYLINSASASCLASENRNLGCGMKASGDLHCADFGQNARLLAARLLKSRLFGPRLFLSFQYVVLFPLP
jgi:hypothetical protein